MRAAPWGDGDLFAIATAIILLIVVIAARKNRRNPEGVTLVLAAGLSLGPLLLIILDPLAQYAGVKTRLLDLVLNEGRATL